MRRENFNYIASKECMRTKYSHGTRINSGRNFLQAKITKYRLQIYNLEPEGLQNKSRNYPAELVVMKKRKQGMRRVGVPLHRLMCLCCYIC